MKAVLDRIMVRSTNSDVDELPLCRACDLRYICGGGCHLPQLKRGLDMVQNECSSEFRRRYRERPAVRAQKHKQVMLLSGISVYTGYGKCHSQSTQMILIARIPVSSPLLKRWDESEILRSSSRQIGPTSADAGHGRYEFSPQCRKSPLHPAKLRDSSNDRPEIHGYAARHQAHFRTSTKTSAICSWGKSCHSAEGGSKRAWLLESDGPSDVCHRTLGTNKQPFRSLNAPI